MPTELEKAREWLRGLVMRDDIGEGFRRSLLAATDPIPPGELAEAAETAEEWAAEIEQPEYQVTGKHGAAAIRTLIRAVRQQPEQPLTELVHVPQTEPPTWIGGMPDCEPPEDEQPEAEALARLESADARSDMDIEDIRLVCRALIILLKEHDDNGTTD